ncbi:large subunit ribosomal protein L29 [Desulfosarcina sp. BuS5]|uniref:50S ribosomal protein L29 n=1 Tax=Desulfosarcina sp. BuS5 TaxID=933262 RepID=UPI0004870D21|nr:50S ribosomal protein L29 [Desulfosarcina sp. BuS5]WDN89281.1 large subunit ribosomal protein L29 [Desulfosarcina sp. BuS5]
MKTGEIRELSLDEMNNKLVNYEEELFNLRFQHQTDQLDNTQLMKKTKRNIARVKTLIREMIDNKDME